MEKELLNFITENNLSPFNKQKTQIKQSNKKIYRTRDATSIHSKVLQKIGKNFVFSDTPNLFSFFEFTKDFQTILKRQEFYKKIKEKGKIENNFLNKINPLKKNWSPKYDILVVTENSDIFNLLKKNNCPCKLIFSENDIIQLKDNDLIQVLECPDLSLALETLPQSVFINSIEEAYLERYLEKLSEWKENFKLLTENCEDSKILDIIKEFFPLFELISDNQKESIDHEYVEKKVEEINNEINEEIKKMTVSGELIVEIISKNSIPEELKEILQKTVFKSGLPERVLNLEIPVSIDRQELDKFIQERNSDNFSAQSEKIKRYSKKLLIVPSMINEISSRLILYDFISGISKFIKKEMIFPELSEELSVKNSKNIFLENPQEISFYLNKEIKCSILTGANSGGKTTLIEHLIQINSLFQLGFPLYGEVKIPLFSDIYYFAKNKGSNNKGAFETLLSQMAGINPGEKTLILADEIESVTEPGVAGSIIAATADYYIKKNCFLVIATHLGQEIQKILPKNTRIDGIEAKGLDDNFELIVDHNPCLGRIANSTPELIVEKMANNQENPYFKYLNNFLKNPIDL